MFADIIENHARDHAGRMAWQRFPRGIDQHQATPPASHAGFRKLSVVIGKNAIDAYLSLETRFRRGDDLQRVLELRRSRHQRYAVLERQSVILGVSNLDPV